MCKAICEMTLEELFEEYSSCVVASQNDALDADNRHYFRDRANIIKKHIEANAPVNGGV